MKFNKWTVALAAVGVVSLTSAARADEKPSALQTALSNTTISGDVSVSANVGLTKNYSYSPADGIPFQPITKENGFNLDVVKLSIAKPEDSTPWASGYEVDVLFGPDAVAYNTSVNTTSLPDYAIKQAFVTLHTPVGNGLDWKLGVFDSPLGYETFDGNPNYTHSWGYSVEPTELTGVEATYTVNSTLTLSGGAVDASGAGIDNRNGEAGGTLGYGSSWHLGYFGYATLTAPASWGWSAGDALSVGVLYGYVYNPAIGGANGIPAAANDTSGYMDNNQVNYYAGLTFNTPWKQLTGGASFDFVQNYGGGYSEDSATFTVNAISLALYGTYKATDKLSFDARAEYYENDGYFSEGDGAYSTEGSGNLVSLTGTVEYDLWANVVSRLELRWDQNLSYASVPGLQSGVLLPLATYDNAVSERESVGLYANIVYKF
jgi:hypothetical protein